MLLRGRCHCGNIAFVFDTQHDPRTIGLRACGCGFCRRHGARTIADPQGHVRFEIREPAELSRYRFGLATADFLVCRRCGAYAGALLGEGARAWATINANLFEDPAPFDRPAEPVDYEGESAEQRTLRRKQRWTPAEPIA